MKKTFLLVVISCLLLKGYSQTETEKLITKNWTISTNLISQPYLFLPKNRLPNVFTGVGITRYFGKIGVRLNYYHFDNNKSSLFLLDSNLVNEHSFSRENVVKIGMEYKKNYADIIALRFFADYAYIPYTSESEIYEDRQTPILFNENKGICHGAIVGLGIDWKFSEHFSLGAETRIDFLFFEQNQKIQNFKNGNTVEYQVSANTMNLKLIGNVSFNYHF